MIDGLPTSFSMCSLAASTTALIGMVFPVYMQTPVLVGRHGSVGSSLSLRKVTIRAPRIG